MCLFPSFYILGNFFKFTFQTFCWMFHFCSQILNFSEPLFPWIKKQSPCSCLKFTKFFLSLPAFWELSGTELDSRGLRSQHPICIYFLNSFVISSEFPFWSWFGVSHSKERGQGRRSGGPTPCPRSCGCVGAGGPRGAIPHWRSRRVAVRRYPSSKVRSNGCALLEQPWRDTSCPS